ncbi:MAG: OPT/YSL family transporter [Pyrinomonadaceae bacterium]
MTAGGPLISAMSAGQVQDLYIRYIAAGAVAAGGIISLVRALPVILGAFTSSLGGFGGKGSLNDDRSMGAVPRTERDMPMTFVLGGIAVLAIAIFAWLNLAGAPTSGVFMNVLSVLLVLVFGFFFATVSSRITGEIGSSSNPISGMTIATILLDLADLSTSWSRRSRFPCAGALSRGDCLHCRVERGHDITRPENWLPCRRQLRRACSGD